MFINKKAHKAFRLQWCQTRRQWNLASWKKVHSTDIQRMIVKVRYNTCFKDVLPIDLFIEVASYCNEVKLTVICYTSPHHDGILRKEQSPQSSCCSRLLARRVDNHTSTACQEFWFKPDRAHLAHYRSSSERNNTAGSKFKCILILVEEKKNNLIQSFCHIT
jgi:hypothetical protein